MDIVKSINRVKKIVKICLKRKKFIFLIRFLAITANKLHLLRYFLFLTLFSFYLL
jgi:hypothetical protein